SRFRSYAGRALCWVHLPHTSLNLHRALLSHAVLYSRSTDPRHLHSFPTRRSSDLAARHRPALKDGHGIPFAGQKVGRGQPGRTRSEEHTSELQSRENLVCRLLLEKKKPLHLAELRIGRQPLPPKLGDPLRSTVTQP